MPISSIRYKLVNAHSKDSNTSAVAHADQSLRWVHMSIIHFAGGYIAVVLKLRKLQYLLFPTILIRLYIL